MKHLTIYSFHAVQPPWAGFFMLDLFQLSWMDPFTLPTQVDLTSTVPRVFKVVNSFAHPWMYTLWISQMKHIFQGGNINILNMFR